MTLVYISAFCVILITYIMRIIIYHIESLNSSSLLSSPMQDIGFLLESSSLINLQYLIWLSARSKTCYFWHCFVLWSSSCLFIFNLKFCFLKPIVSENLYMKLKIPFFFASSALQDRAYLPPMSQHMKCLINCMINCLINCLINNSFRYIHSASNFIYA